MGRSTALRAWLTAFASANRGAAALIPLAAIMLLALGMLTVTSWLGAVRLDATQRASEVRLLSETMATRLDQLARIATQLTVGEWLDLPASSRTELRRLLWQRSGIDAAFLLDPDGTIQSLDVSASSSPATASLPAVASAAARLARALSATGASLGKAGYVEGDAGLPGIAVASLPPRGDGSTSHLVVAEQLDAEYLAGLGTGVGLAQPHFGPGGAGDAVLPLMGAEGKILAQLAWPPARPGSQQLLDLLPLLAGAVLIVAFFAALAFDNVRRAVARIRESETRFRDIAEAGSDWIWETDEALRFTFLSEQFTRTTGMARERALGRPMAELLEPRGEGWVPADPPASFRDLVCHLRSFGLPPLVMRVAGQPICGRRGDLQGYRGTATDITAEIAAVEQARFLAEHDSLTRLPNRNLLRRSLRETEARWGRYGTHAAVLCLDLDGFKGVNDRLGHAAGDRLLRACADRLRSAVRQLDLVARLGGDEFAIVMSEIDGPADVEALCERLVRVVAEPYDLGDEQVTISTSVGSALLPADAVEPDRLMESADIALYRAKSEGRNRFRFFESGMEEQLRHRKMVASGLQTALAKGELELHYQSVVEAATSRIVAYEALLRWRNPDCGLLMPGDFLGIAEATGLMPAIGDWVLRQACNDAAGWSEAAVAVNVSASQLREKELARSVGAALLGAGLSADRLHLEVTDELLATMSAEAATVLDELRQLGVSLTLDDFGADSSLGRLQRLQVHGLKIDGSLVHDMVVDQAQLRILQAIIDVAHGLGIKVCAEAVETEEQRQLLLELGCDALQGFLLGQPRPEPIPSRARSPAAA